MQRPNAIPAVSPRPPSPDRDDEQTFADRADARFEHDLNVADPELNAIGQSINEHTDYMEYLVDQAENLAGLSNYQGEWRARSYVLGASVLHNSAYWINGSDGNTSEPGVSGWTVINIGNDIDAVNQALSTKADTDTVNQALSTKADTDTVNQALATQQDNIDNNVMPLVYAALI